MRKPKSGESVYRLSFGEVGDERLAARWYFLMRLDVLAPTVLADLLVTFKDCEPVSFGYGAFELCSPSMQHSITEWCETHGFKDMPWMPNVAAETIATSQSVDRVVGWCLPAPEPGEVLPLQIVDGVRWQPDLQRIASLAPEATGPKLARMKARLTAQKRRKIAESIMKREGWASARPHRAPEHFDWFIRRRFRNLRYEELESEVHLDRASIRVACSRIAMLLHELNCAGIAGGSKP